MVRIPDEWLNAVLFLGTRASNAVEELPRWKGTGFVLSAPGGSAPGGRELYLVTARHNIEGARQEGNLWLRQNTADGRSISVEVDPNGPWRFHDDATVDFAIASPSALGDFAFPFAMATEQILTFYLVGIIRSHWDERPSGAPADLPRPEWLNRGIAAITPATGIAEMLETG